MFVRIILRIFSVLYTIGLAQVYAEDAYIMENN